MAEICEHLDTLVLSDFPTIAEPRVCADCVREGTEWVELRQCRTCGHVGCCDSSPRRHATAHFRETGHPVIRSAMPDATWDWCYVHEVGGDLA